MSSATVHQSAGPDDQIYERVLSPSARPTGGRVRLFLAQVAAELRQNYRVPEYVVGVVAVPIILYSMFGLPNASIDLPGGTQVGAMMLASMSCYGVVSLAIFTFGVDTAAERDKGWLRRLRSTPMPMWAYFAAKTVMALVFSAIILALMIGVASLIGKVAFDVPRLLRACAVLLAGTVTFATAGFALAYLARPKAASAIGNLLFLPLSFLSGFFFPLRQLPEVFSSIAQWLPTYHFGQVVWGQMAPVEDVVAFGSPAPGNMTVHVAVMVAAFLGFGVLAALGYRRDLHRTRG